ncbi:copper amine oxidase N-terminal domain-containing protein [Paenibacillus hunanensis]|uniref:copper amine oxidase N-terminal domain-containing protein n=1 Tax=Paenibacillus hunanensis TaxID=539262 RepID=UPI002A69F5F2|nr:copper amine oxidase N-terminal domain-containing protein [Paenibacillus hunanensis]WPP42280.1 copper amine oxidase N-terminal domain-containing protein [Paenibacillus hunanensis]
MMNKKSYTALLLSATLLFSPLAAPQAQAAAGSSYQFKIITKTDQYSSVYQDSAYMRNGTLYVQLNYLASNYGLESNFDATGKRAGFNGWLKKIGVRDGSKTAVVDGKIVTMSQSAYFKKEKDSKEPGVYVPFKFAVEALGGTYVGYNAKTKVVTAKNLKKYDVVSTSYDGMTYAIEKGGGNVFSWDGKGKPVKIASLQGDLDWVDFKIRSTPKGLVLFSISNSYGEPHINSETYQLLFKEGKLIRQNHADFGWGRSDLIDTYNGQILMNDGKKLRLIEDGTGNVAETLDLTKLGNKGADQQYSIEAMDDDMMLIRNSHDYQLAAVDRSSGRSVVLYKEVLSSAEQQNVDIDSGGGPMGSGDGLTYEKRVGNTLYFTYNPLFDSGKRTVTYDLSKLINK